MRINRPALKSTARARMREARPNIYLVSLVCALALYLIGELSTRLLFPVDLVHYVINWDQGTIGIYISPDYYARIWREPVPYIISLLLAAARMMLEVGMLIFCLNAARRAACSFWNLVDGFASFFRLIALYIVESVFVFLWSLLFIIPGIVASYRYRLAIYLLLERPELGVMDCIRESKRLMNGRKGELFVMDLSFIGWTILTIIPFVSIFVTPYMQTTFAAYYLAVVEDDRRGGEFSGGWEDGRPGGDENGGDNPREY